MTLYLFGLTTLFISTIIYLIPYFNNSLKAIIKHDSATPPVSITNSIQYYINELGLTLSALALCFALASQFLFDLQPCPYCILIRYFLLSSLIFHLLAYLLIKYENIYTWLYTGAFFCWFLALISSVKFALFLTNPYKGCTPPPWLQSLETNWLAQTLPFFFYPSGSCFDPYSYPLISYAYPLGTLLFLTITTISFICLQLLPSHLKKHNSLK